MRGLVLAIELPRGLVVVLALVPELVGLEKPAYVPPPVGGPARIGD